MKIKDIRLKPLFSKFKKPYVWAMGKNLGQITILVEIETEDMTLNIGPQHPSTHGTKIGCKSRWRKSP